MKKPLVIIGIIVLLVFVGLSGCESSPSNKIYGKWKFELSTGTTVYQTFYRNGSYSIEQPSINHTGWSNFTLTDKVIYYDINAVEYFFSTDNKKLVLTNIENQYDITILERV